MSQREELVCCVGCSCETLISPAVERATAVGWDDKCRTNNKPPTYFQDECEFGMHAISERSSSLQCITCRTEAALHYSFSNARTHLNVYCFMNQPYDLTIKIMQNYAHYRMLLN